MAYKGKITVSTEELTAQANVVRSELKSISTLFENLSTRLERTEQYWIGTAGDTHRSDYRTQLKNVDEIIARYNEHVTDLLKMAGVYETAEMQAVSEADKLPVSTL